VQVDAPLHRNRDFVLLQAGQLLSSVGTGATAIVYPLLVLAVTGSPAQAGVVGFARLLPQPLLSLVAGIVVDRFDRRRLMIAADAVRAIAVATLGGVILEGDVAFWLIVVVALVEGSASVLFASAQPGALRSVVPTRQLAAAAGAQEARNSVADLVGRPLGGVLFGISRAVPFLFDAVTYSASIVSLALMRTPFQETREPRRAAIRAQLAEGFAFLWHHPFLRTTAFVYGLGNFTIPGVLFVVVVAGKEQGLSGGTIGLLSALFGACTLLGAVASPLFRRTLSTRTIMLNELWLGLGSLAFVAWPNVYVLALAILPQAVCLPVTDSVVIGYRLAITPDRLLGRVESVRRTIALAAAPLGPLVAGFLLGATSARETIAVFAAVTLALALWGTLSRAVKEAPSLAEVEAATT